MDVLYEATYTKDSTNFWVITDASICDIAKDLDPQEVIQITKQ